MAEESRGSVVNMLLILTLFLIILLGYIQNVVTEDFPFEEPDGNVPIDQVELFPKTPGMADQEKYFLDVSNQFITANSETEKIIIFNEKLELIMCQKYAP